MKSKILWIIILIVAIALVTAWQGKKLLSLLHSSKTAATDPAEAAISYWTCSMHPQVHQDSPGLCPICHMQLVPVYKDAGHNHASEDSSITIDSARQRQSGIRLTEVKREPFRMVLRTTGKVALDVEIASAVREFVELGRQDPTLRRTALTRLKLLGMGPEEIHQLEQNPSLAQTLYQPATPGIAWVYATLYEQEVDLVRPGATVTISPSFAPEKELTGTVRSVSPIVDQASRSVRARILVRDPAGILRPEAYLRVSIFSDLGPSIVIPRSAIVYTGRKQIVFVAGENETFRAREIRTGHESGEQVVVVSGLNAGDRIVTSGAFLIDSESRLQSALESVEE